MLIYMAIPVLIMIGLCIFFYMAGRYIRIGKKREEVKAPEMIKEPESPKGPDRVPILEEENRNLKEALEIKNKELEEWNKAAESIMQENQKLLARIRQENIDKQREEAEETMKLKARISQLEEELAAKNAAVQPVSSSYEDVLKEPKEKVKRKKPKEKVKRKSRRKKR